MNKKEAFYNRKDYLIDLVNEGIDFKEISDFINIEYDENCINIFSASSIIIPKEKQENFFKILSKYYIKYYIDDVEKQKSDRYSFYYFNNEFIMYLIKNYNVFDEKILNVVCEYPSFNLLNFLAKSISKFDDKTKIKHLIYIKEHLKLNDNYNKNINDFKKYILLYCSNLSDEFKKEYNHIFEDNNRIVKSENNYDYVKNKMKSFLQNSKGYYDYIGLSYSMEKDLKILSPKDNFKIYCEILKEIIADVEELEHFSNIFNFIREIRYFDNVDLSNKIYNLFNNCEKSSAKNKLGDIYHRYFYFVEPTIILLFIKNSMFDEAKELYDKSKKLKTICSDLEYQLDQDKKLFNLDDNELEMLNKIRQENI